MRKPRLRIIICALIAILLFCQTSIAEINDPIVGFCRNDKQYTDAWGTPAHIYAKPSDTSEIIRESWGANGNWYTMYENLGEWLKVRYLNPEGYIKSDGITVFPVETTSATKAIETAGVYQVGKDMPAGVYVYRGESESVTVQSDYYESKAITYTISFSDYPIYLPPDSVIALHEEDALTPLLQTEFTPIDGLTYTEDARYFMPFELPQNRCAIDHPITYSFMLIDETSYINMYDLLGNDLGGAGYERYQEIGEFYELSVYEGAFLEVYHCIIICHYGGKG